MLLAEPRDVRVHGEEMPFAAEWSEMVVRQEI
jgi:hypothetical protein